MNMRRITFGSMLLVLLLLAPAACGRRTGTPTADDTLLKSPLSAAEGAAPTAVPRDATPAPGLGMVFGLLSMDGRPAAGQFLFLAEIISSEEALSVAALDPVRDPRAETDRTGYFMFPDVPPGRYALAILSPGGTVVIRGPDDLEIVAEVSADASTDLGTVRIVPFGQ